MSEQLYTSSRIRVWRECHRKHLYKYVLRIRTPQTPAMAFGTHMHGALEAWYRAWKDGADRFVAAISYIDAIEDIDDIDRVKLRVLVIAYDRRWQHDDWEVIAVEREFDYELRDDETGETFKVGGKIDALIRRRDSGAAWLLEHKTSTVDTSEGSGYRDRLTIDTQVSLYIDGAAYGIGVQVAGCIYDIIKRPQHELLLATPEDKRKYTAGKGCKLCGGKLSGVQGSGKSGATTDGNCAACKGSGWRLDENGQPEAPRLYAAQRAEDETLEEFEERLRNEIAERPDDFLARTDVFRLDSELPRMREELLDTIKSMKKLAEANLHSPNHDACIRGRNECAFFNACVGRSDINNEYAWPRREHAHQELSATHSANAA